MSDDASTIMYVWRLERDRALCIRKCSGRNRFDLALLFPLPMMVLMPNSLSSSRPAGLFRVKCKLQCRKSIKETLVLCRYIHKLLTLQAFKLVFMAAIFPLETDSLLLTLA